MRVYKFIIPVLLIPLMSGCVTFSGKKEEDLKIGIHATQKSIRVGRIDLADAYISQAARLVPEPKKMPPIKPFVVPRTVTRTTVTAGGVVTNTVIEHVTNTVTRTERINTVVTNTIDPDTYIVVPEYLKGLNLLVVNSEEYNSILAENRTLKNQIEKEKSALKTYEKSVTKTLELKEKEYEKAMAELQKARGWWGFWKKISWLSFLFPLAIIGLIAACVLNPAIIPIVVKIFGQIVEIAGRLFGAVVNFVNWIIKKITEWNNK